MSEIKVTILGGDIPPPQIQIPQGLLATFKGFDEHLAHLFRSLNLASINVGNAHPPNLRSADLPLEELERLIYSEGLPLAATVRRRTLEEVRTASSEAMRRQIIARRWRSILTDCLRTINEASPLQADGAFALEAIEAARAGYFAAAQSLAMNHTDMLLGRHLMEYYKALSGAQNTKRKKKIQIDYRSLSLPAWFALAPTWHLYAYFSSEEGTPIPRTLGRHPTTHAVSPKQFTRANAVLAVMHLTSIIWFLSTETKVSGRGYVVSD